MIEVNNQSGSKLDTRFFKMLGERVLREEGAGSSTVSVAFVKARTMRELNKKYRSRDYAENVLSFPFGEESTLSRVEGSGVEGCLGEVILCPSQIRRDAKKYGITGREALSRMFVHGVLHLLRYDHEKSSAEARRMEAKERSLLKQFVKV